MKSIKKLLLIGLVLGCFTYVVTQAYLQAVYTSEFKVSLCYSRIFHEISDRLEQANESMDLNKHKDLATLLDTLDVGNYDTDCQRALDVLLAFHKGRELKPEKCG